MDWSNWTCELPLLLESSDDWERMFFKNYIDSPLCDPKVLINKSNKYDLCIERVHTLIQAYKQVLRLVETNKDFLCILKCSLDFYTKYNIQLYISKIKYGDIQIPILPIHPFAFYILPDKFQWVHIIHHDKVPKSFDIVWDTSYYSDFQIKLPQDANFRLDFAPLLNYRMIRFNGNIIYLFEQQKEQTENINFSVNIESGDDKPYGDIYINYGRSKLDHEDKTKDYISKIKSTTNKLSSLEKQIIKEKNCNKCHINEYKKHFCLKNSHI